MRSVSILLAVAISGCSTKAVEPIKQSGGLNHRPELEVAVRSQGERCEFKHVDQAEWSTELDDILVAAAQSGNIRVTASEDTSWKCIAGTIYQLQKFGTPVGFISNPIDEVLQE